MMTNNIYESMLIRHAQALISHKIFQYFIKVIALIILIAPPINNTFADTSRDKLIAVYIFRLAEHIQWHHAAEKNAYHFHIIDSNKNISSQLKGITRIRKVHGKDFRVTQDSTDLVPKGAELVFIANDHIDKYQSVFNQTENKNILLISDNLNNDRYSLIDLRESSHNKISFKINKANILNRNLGLNPDIILMGGTEIDVARLYREGLRNLHQQNQKLSSLKQNIESLRAQSKKLNTDLNKAKNEESQLAQKLIIAEKENLKQNKQILEDQKHIEEQKAEVSQLKKQLQTILDNIDEKNSVIQGSEQKLIVLNEEISLNTEILAQKNQEILFRTKEIEEQGDIITDQIYFLQLLTVIGVLAILLLVVSLLAYRNKNILNSKLQKYAEELAEAKSIAEKTTQAKSKFLSNMSHDLRSPLTSIIGFSHLIYENLKIPEDIKQHSRIIIRSADYLLALINDVLDLAKIESGQIEFINDDVNFPNLVRDVESMSRIIAEKKGLNLIVDIPADFSPHYIHVDASKIRRILINLINNAIKFTQKGEVLVYIQCKPVKNTDKIELYFEIKDSGIGIGEDHIDKIFLPFEQVLDAQNETNLQQGTGLGLSLSKELIERMQGSITVESKPGQGSTFIFSVMVDRGIKNDGLETDSIEKIFSGVKPRQYPVKALIVEDIRNSALYLEQILKDCQCQTKCASNGKEAIEAFKSWQPDIIWMDIRIPDINGIEAAKMIRQLPGGQDTKIIAVTASVLDKNRQEIMQHSFDDFMKKPYLIQEIRDFLEKYMQVEFIYRDRKINQSFQLADINLEDLNNLPLELKNRLKSAVLALDIDETTNLIEQLSIQYPESASRLQELISAYDFGSLQSITKQF